jgi:cytosine/adenosine deaminase-related metal-dependent hydrolase
LSPHAPYTVHPELLAGCAELAQRFGVPLAMHLAESREELELLQSQSGGFRDLLNELNVWSSEAFRSGGRVLDYLRPLSAAPRALVIHGNYLDREEIAFLAGHARRMSVVYCPRTHDYFRHEPYPLSQMLAGGVALALGTDSRASNPDLSLFEEMRFVARRHPALAPKQVLDLGTIGGARALGIEGETGSLTPGKRADLAIVALPEEDAADPHELLFADRSKVVRTWLCGRATPIF